VGSDAPMPGPRDAPADDSASGIPLAVGLFTGSALLAAVDAAAIALAVPLPTAGIALRLAHHLFDAAETLGVGALAGGVAGAFVRFVRIPAWASTTVAVAVLMALVHAAIGPDLAQMASLTAGGRFETAIALGYLVLFGAGLAGAYAVGSRSARSGTLRGIAVAVAVAGVALDHVPFPDDYFGIHAVIAGGAALLGGGALGPAGERALRALRRHRRGRVAAAALASLAFLGLVVPPPNAVRFELFRERCALAPWVLATLVWRAPSLHGAVPPAAPSPWLRDRSADAPALPTTPPLLPRDAVVVLLTVDAVGADVVDDPANDALLPTLTELKRDGIVFTHAGAPGTQTPLSLGTVFSGRYFSELTWTDHGVGGTRYLYPADDPSPRFPELLSSHGVATADYAGLTFLAAEFGVARGFREETVTVEGRQHAAARELIDPLLERLKHAGPGPLFLYTHLLEPHEPYDRGRKSGTARERYLSEVAVADAQIRRVLRMLETRFGKRWALFVSSDHGEAFGEHGGTQHGKTLYEELLHVPLLARAPLFVPRTVDQRVGLVDLGPTILDLFGVDTPATYEGQSLVPLLAGGEATLTRPLLAEGRLRRALTLPDGLKVIEDSRRKVVEAYDLATDPGETRNLFDLEPARVDPALAWLRAFFAVHTRTEGGYRPPYKP
jgi:arylsulfatase A-like enzyme